MDYSSLLQSLAGGALITAGLTLAQLLFEYANGSAKRAADQRDRRFIEQRDADIRLERVLQDRLADADRRLDRLQQTQDLLLERYAALELNRPRPRSRQDRSRTRAAAALPAGPRAPRPRRTRAAGDTDIDAGPAGERDRRTDETAA